MRLCFSVLSFFLYSMGLSAQCCNDDNKVTLCYTAQDDHCDFAACGYTYDGRHMDGISAKITNANNFGTSGTSCDIDPIPIGNISSVQEIEALGCEIIFLGHFAPDNNAGFGTTLPTIFLRSIREWSMVCQERLVILFQDEAQLWGYEIDNTNTNPNRSGNNDILNIFDGPFGSIAEFEQGGSFQANFRQLADTGSIILANDGNGRPTIVLDEMTNDIVMADVGIFCEGVGGISETPNVLTNNDILACNILALGCTIASSEWYEEYVDACDGEDYTLPDGQVVNSSGDYFSNLVNQFNCDSTVLTHLNLLPPVNATEFYTGCQGDGYSVVVDGTTFNESNPSDVVALKTRIGCDSTVTVELEFFAPSASAFDTILCASSNFMYNGLLIDDNIDTILVLENFEGCDSLIEVSAEVYSFPNSVVETEIEIVNGRAYQFQNEIPTELVIIWSTETGLSCTDCPNPEVNLDNRDIESYSLILTNAEGCTETYSVDVNHSCKPYVPNTFLPNSGDDNEDFGPLVPCEISEYNFVIYDKWGGTVFESTDQSEKWTGSNGANDYEMGTYVYRLSYTDLEKPITLIGMVTIIR